MDRILRLLLIGATALTFAGPALAADYDAPIFVENAPEYVPVEIGSGWYLRGDVGYSNGTRANGPFAYRTFDPLTSTYGSSNFDTGELSEDFTYGIGVGYQFSEWLRADATLDGIRSDFFGTTASTGPCPGGVVGTGCRTENTSSVSALSLMANGYVDLGTIAGFTPYVGAGAGMSRISWSGMTDRFYCVDGGVACGGAAFADTTHPGEESWRFTYALMAGMAVDVAPNFKIDLGYKFRHINGGTMFGWDAASAGAGATGSQGSDDGFTSHEVRVGLRYLLW